MNCERASNAALERNRREGGEAALPLARMK